MILAELTETVMTLGHDLDPNVAYEIFRKSYEEETGASWSKEKFLDRAYNWTFYGDKDGFVAVRAQRSGPKKLVGVAGNPKSVMRGLTELQAEGGPIWGAVSEPLARMAVKRGLICPSFVTGGPLLIKTLISTIPPYVFGGTEPTVNKDGSLVFAYDDVGSATKYLIGNKAYFSYCIGLPQVKEKLAAIPGVKMILSMLGMGK